MMMLMMMMTICWFVCDIEKEKEFICHVSKQ